MSLITVKSRAKEGFALVIALSLMAFVLLLLLSVSTLVSVETSLATSNLTKLLAQQNARLSMLIAVGELQKYTGPDQSTTARSDMDASLANTTTGSGRWIGAYGNAGLADYEQSPSEVSATIVAASDSKGSQAKLLNWLVSGNESTAFNPAVDVGVDGNIQSAPSEFEFAPNALVSGLNSDSSGLTNTITLQGKSNSAQPARILVGPNTVGDSPTDFVAAPLVEIPGGRASAAPGRYAWWVGDENMKARVNLPMVDEVNKDSAFVVSQRDAVELIDAVHEADETTLDTADMLDPVGADARYDPNNARLPEIFSTELLPLLTPTASSDLETFAQFRFHDVSARSQSVLSDTYAGGLKKDLSALLATGSTEPKDTDLIFPPEPGNNYNFVGVPTWGELRSFAQTTSSELGLLPRAPAMTVPSGYSGAPVATNVGVAPVMSYSAYGFRMIAPDGDAVGNRVGLAIVPIVVLWNPYSATIRGRDDDGNVIRYEVGFRKAFSSKFQLQGRPEASGAPGSYTWSEVDVIDTYDMSGYGSGHFFRFVIEIPAAGIAPGESLIFTLSNNGDDYQSGKNVLTNGFNDNYYVMVPDFSTTITPELGANAYYRVASDHHDDTDTPRTMWGYNTKYTNNENWRSGWLEAYLGTPDMGANRQNSSYPWNSSKQSTGVYQFFSPISGPFNGRPPYGNGSTGYAVSSGKTGLLQPEAQLETNMTIGQPAWRIVVRSNFSNIANDNTSLEIGRGRWMLQRNIRSFMAMNFVGKPANKSWPSGLITDDDKHASSGTGLAELRNDTVLYEFRPDSLPLLSIGQFQHANLGWLGKAQSYAIGNSNGGAGIHFDSDGDLRPEQLYKAASFSTGNNAPANRIKAYYDYSWLLNRSIWDRYFVSTVPHAGTGRQAAPADTDSTEIPDVLPFSNHVQREIATSEELRDADQAAAQLMLEGGFNINSTSEQAWRAVLGGTNQLDFDPTEAGIGGGAWEQVVFSRFSQPTTNATNSAWLGYKQLDEVQIARLAKNIVDEIRARGPFVSLADFVNRRLYTPDVEMQPNDVRLKGPIQAAIDAVTSGPEAINSVDAGSPLNILASTTDSYKVVGSFKNASKDPFSVGSHTPDNPTPPYGTSGAGSPQFLTQADVLSTIGSRLSARSDTFVIRAYGEVLNPVGGGSSDIVARAWCEATVQRYPEYVDTSIEPELALGTLPDSDAKTTNARFGRKYKIISFRWLPQNEI